MEARESNGKEKAIKILSNLIGAGEERQKEVIQAALKRVITDKLVAPEVTNINVSGGQVTIYRTGDNSGDKTRVSNHALNQICSTIELPKHYVNKLLDECVGMPGLIRDELLTNIMNTHLWNGVYLDRKKEPARFLHRAMDGTLMGFLTRSYNRKLGTVAMLRPFLEECVSNGAKPTQALHSALKTSLQCVSPIIYEPIDGEFVAFGATYTNSDFGAGGLQVSDSVLRISSGVTNVMEDKLRKIHLGALISESEIELSDETLAKESAAHMSAVKDSVRNIFSSESIEKNLELIRLSSELKIPWERLKAKVRHLLSKEELEKLSALLTDTAHKVIDLPPVTFNSSGDPEANAWWAAAALGHISSGVLDVERKVELQELSGALLKS